jgi:hypothetical protein
MKLALPLLCAGLLTVGCRSREFNSADVNESPHVGADVESKIPVVKASPGEVAFRCGDEFLLRATDKTVKWGGLVGNFPYFTAEISGSLMKKLMEGAGDRLELTPEVMNNLNPAAFRVIETSVPLLQANIKKNNPGKIVGNHLEIEHVNQWVSPAYPGDVSSPSKTDGPDFKAGHLGQVYFLVRDRNPENYLLTHFVLDANITDANNSAKPAKTMSIGHYVVKNYPLKGCQQVVKSSH